MTKRVKAGRPPAGHSKHVTALEVHQGLLSFSFRHFDDGHERFGTSRCGENYLAKLVDRLKEVSGMTLSELHANRSTALRAHPIDWSRTAVPEGFKHLNEQLQSCTPMQFSVSSNAHGRVHGFILGNTFFVVWLDPEHNLYP